MKSRKKEITHISLEIGLRNNVNISQIHKAEERRNNYWIHCLLCGKIYFMKNFNMDCITQKCFRETHTKIFCWWIVVYFNVKT